MSRLDSAPEIISMALALKLDTSRGAVREIIRLCHDKLAGFLAKAGGVKTLDELQTLVATCLHLVFEEVWTDEDLVRVTTKYIAMGETAFASLRMQLEGDTFATLMEREHVKARVPDRYVAVIDCRGGKAARRYFTRWHEIAHLLTLVKQLELPFHRSKCTSQDPLERLMDMIAGDIGFYKPLFEPALHAELADAQLLTFEGVQRVRDQVCPNASFHSTLIACVNRSPTPTIVLEAAMALKKAEAAEVRSGQLAMFTSLKPKPKLRAVTSTQNSAARASGFIIHRNMAIPPASLVATHFEETESDSSHLTAHADEDLSIWRHTNGEPVGHGDIHVEAKRIGGILFAIVQRRN